MIPLCPVVWTWHVLHWLEGSWTWVVEVETTEIAQVRHCIDISKHTVTKCNEKSEVCRRLCSSSCFGWSWPRCSGQVEGFWKNWDCKPCLHACIDPGRCTLQSACHVNCSINLKWNSNWNGVWKHVPIYTTSEQSAKQNFELRLHTLARKNMVLLLLLQPFYGLHLLNIISYIPPYMRNIQHSRIEHRGQKIR